LGFLPTPLFHCLRFGRPSPLAYVRFGLTLPH
jgi:hypothetical protein